MGNNGGWLWSLGLGRFGALQCWELRGDGTLYQHRARSTRLPLRRRHNRLQETSNIAGQTAEHIAMSMMVDTQEFQYVPLTESPDHGPRTTMSPRSLPALSVCRPSLRFSIAPR